LLKIDVKFSFNDDIRTLHNSYLGKNLAYPPVSFALSDGRRASAYYILLATGYKNFNVVQQSNYFYHE